MPDTMVDRQPQSVYNYNLKALNDILLSVIQENLTPEAWRYLEERSASFQLIPTFLNIFITMPRKTGKRVIRLTEDQNRDISSIRHGFSVMGWTIDRLCRVWMLMQLDPADKEKYFRTIENLFLTGEMQELVALYSALPVLAYPDLWIRRCSEGIRSNIGTVLQAIMCHNPYPSENLSQGAWNQLVLKAFFTEKPVHEVVGLDKRANPELARILSDYAHERWAAGRPVNPQLWRCVGPFIDETNFGDIERMARSENTVEREAAALSCSMSQYPPARELLNKNKELKSAIESGDLTWETIAEKQ